MTSPNEGHRLDTARPEEQASPMNTAQTATQQPTGACPATGRTAGVCLDRTHAECWIGRADSVALDRKLERRLP